MKSWNPIQASFYLLAAIIGVEVLIVVVTFFSCLIWDLLHPENPKHCDGLKQPLTDILQDAIATVMAFSAGKLSGDKSE